MLPTIQIKFCSKGHLPTNRSAPLALEVASTLKGNCTPDFTVDNLVVLSLPSSKLALSPALPTYFCLSVTPEEVPKIR